MLQKRKDYKTKRNKKEERGDRRNVQRKGGREGERKGRCKQDPEQKDAKFINTDYVTL